MNTLSKRYPQEYVHGHCPHCGKDTEQLHQRHYTAILNEITGEPVLVFDLLYMTCQVCHNTATRRYHHEGASNERA